MLSKRFLVQSCITIHTLISKLLCHVSTLISQILEQTTTNTFCCIEYGNWMYFFIHCYPQNGIKRILNDFGQCIIGHYLGNITDIKLFSLTRKRTADKIACQMCDFYPCKFQEPPEIDCYKFSAVQKNHREFYSPNQCNTIQLVFVRLYWCYEFNMQDLLTQLEKKSESIKSDKLKDHEADKNKLKEIIISYQHV